MLVAMGMHTSSHQGTLKLNRLAFSMIRDRDRL